MNLIKKMDNKTRLLTELLELSEKHFNENNYIIIANMLKEIHEKKKNIRIGEFKRLEVPVIIQTISDKFDDDVLENIDDTITIVGYKETSTHSIDFIYSIGGCKGEDVENYQQIKSIKLKDLLKILLKLNRVLCLKIESRLNKETTFNYVDYREYLIELEDGDDIYNDELTTSYFVEQYHNECVDIIYSIIFLSF
jgi:hypothetical protein